MNLLCKQPLAQLIVTLMSWCGQSHTTVQNSQPCSQASPTSVLQIAFSMIHGSGRVAKNGEGLGTLIT